MTTVKEKFTENSRLDYFSEDFEAMERELEVLDKEQTLRITINEGLESALCELQELEAQLPKEQKATLLELCKDNVLQTIEGQFGLASLVITSQSGGNVTTTHNFEQGKKDGEWVIAQKDRAKYEKWQENMKRPWQDVRKEVGYDEPLPSMRKKAFQTQDIIISDYTGKPLPKDGAHLDHIVSASEIEKSAKANLHLSEEQRAKIACDKANLAWSEASANQSKGDNKMDEWLDKKDKKTGQTKAEKYGIDKEKALAKDKKARKSVYGKIDTQAVKNYTKELALTGGKDAAKMAAYSALGVVLRDLVQGLFIEIRATFDSSKKESLKEIFHRFKTRLGEILKNIKAKWKDIFAGSLEAGIMAFLSNIVVFVINLFATTLKRIVSIIRAGFVSLCQAVKILANPPKDMPRDEVNYQALKILITGLIGALSLGLAEGIEKLLYSVPGLNALMSFPVPLINETVGAILSTTLSALIGGLLSTIALYYMDKWRSGDKESRLKLQIMTKSGEIVQYKVAQSWFVLKDAYEYLAYVSADTSRKISATKNEIWEAQEKTQNSLNELDSAMQELRQLNQKLTQGANND